MKLQAKIAISLFFGAIVLAIAVSGVTKYLVQKEGGQNQELPEPDHGAPTEIYTSTYSFEEGYVFDLSTNWELESSDFDRAVDRYRFERIASDGILTFSFYDEYSSFDEIIDARYGGGFVDQVTDLEIHGAPAKRLTSSFLDFGNSIDMIIQIDENNYVSLYGTQIPEGENALQIVNEIDSMQVSFRKSE